jgi:hypothetical protein
MEMRMYVVVGVEVPNHVTRDLGPVGVGTLVHVGVEDVTVVVLEAHAGVVESALLDGVEADGPEAGLPEVEVAAAVGVAVTAAVVGV